MTPPPEIGLERADCGANNALEIGLARAGHVANNTRNNTFADVTYERQKGDRSRSSTFGVKLGINF